MNKKQYHYFLKKNRPRNKQNPVAEQLSDGRYQQRVVKSKKVYERQKLKNPSRDCEWDMSDV